LALSENPTKFMSTVQIGMGAKTSRMIWNPCCNRFRFSSLMPIPWQLVWW
jgi:hypothetical protein